MTASAFHHVPVLLDACLEALKIRPDGTYVDCTLGGGGHASAIVAKLGSAGSFVGLDRDEDALAAANQRLARNLAEHPDPPQVAVTHSPWSGLSQALTEEGLEPGSVDGLLADLGVSSHQLDTARRGFSFGHDGPLDMRMDQRDSVQACDLVNELSEEELRDLLWTLGEERDARRIARAVVQRRDNDPFRTTLDLAGVVAKAKGGRRGARTHPATKTFQALRMRVNRESEELQALLEQGLRWLRPGGRWVVITFHSGDDRPVKRAFRDLARGCTCPPDLPLCVCGNQPKVRLPRRKGQVASEDECAANPRARSARLRVAERLDTEGEGG